MQGYKVSVESPANLKSNIWETAVARWISRIFSPLIITLILTALITVRINSLSAWLWSVFYLVVSVLFPILYIYIQIQRGIISNFDLRDRKQRIRPMLLILVLSFLGLVIMWVGSAPWLLIAFAETAVILLGIMLLITLYWKISGHTTAAASFSVLMIAFFGNIAYLSLAVPLLVAWSRVYLERHDRSQTVAGITLGLCIGGIFLAFLGLKGFTLRY